jgi:hypothetical protein
MSTVNQVVLSRDTEAAEEHVPQNPANVESGRRFVDWQGRRYNAQLLRSPSSATSVPPLWAVSRGGEFIGTMESRSEETTKEFEIRCVTWLRDLYYGSTRA